MNYQIIQTIRGIVDFVTDLNNTNYMRRMDGTSLFFKNIKILPQYIWPRSY